MALHKVAEILRIFCFFWYNAKCAYVKWKPLTCNKKKDTNARTLDEKFSTVTQPLHYTRISLEKKEERKRQDLHVKY